MRSTPAPRPWTIRSAGSGACRWTAGPVWNRYRASRSRPRASAGLAAPDSPRHFVDDLA
ncbi:hypothetical protein ACFQY7_22495 [Actinomadura luteofluorescens]|uniref:hypothetical protein n=1 Tax=Actinomadura luteofluorescens TaxID=46163 RepID=UPI003627FCB8